MAKNAKTYESGRSLKTLKQIVEIIDQRLDCLYKPLLKCKKQKRPSLQISLILRKYDDVRIVFVH